MPRGYNRYCMAFFSALANPLRIAILQSLLRNEKTVTQLASELKKERTLVSHNLAALLGVELVFFKKQGKERVYRVNERAVAPLFMLLEKLVCTRCSLRSSCRVAQLKGFKKFKLAGANRSPCKGCRPNY